jgi:hypothetical protein
MQTFKKIQIHNQVSLPPTQTRKIIKNVKNDQCLKLKKQCEARVCKQSREGQELGPNSNQTTPNN